MILLFIISLFRVPKELGMVYSIEKHNADTITAFLQNSPSSVVIFAQNLTQFEFTNYAIRRYSRDIHFGVGTKEAAELLKVDRFPSIVEFNKTRFHSYYKNYEDAIWFSYWCKSIATNATDSHEIFEYEELRQVFESTATFLLGVDIKFPPEDYKRDIPFIKVPSKLFSFFNLPVSAGYYIYKGLDRQLVEANRNYHKYINSPFVAPDRDITKKPYYCGFFIDTINKTTSELQMKIALKMTSTFSKNVNFCPIFASTATYLANLANLSFIKSPYIAIWKSDDLSKHRWVVRDQNIIFDAAKIEEYINDVISGKQKMEGVSEPVDPTNKEQIVYANFYEKVFNQNNHSAVLFSTGKKKQTYTIHRIFDYTKRYLPQLLYYDFDLSQNDIPENIHIRVQPCIFLFKKGSKSPIGISFGSSFQDFIHNLVYNLDDVEAPKIDYNKIQIEIQNDIAKNLRK